MGWYSAVCDAWTMLKLILEYINFMSGLILDIVSNRDSMKMLHNT